MNFGIYPTLTRDYILQRVTQEQIMEKYLGIPVVQDVLIKSPLRTDANPTCSFYYNQYNRLRFRDYSGHFWGDCFDVVANELKVDSKNKREFQLVLHQIARDFGIHQYENEDAIAAFDRKLEFFSTKRETIPTQFRIELRSYNSYDHDYWSPINVSKDLLQIGRVYFAQEIEISKNNLPFTTIYKYRTNDPAYCFYGGKFPNGVIKWKIYYPMRKAKGELGFHSNSSFLQGKHLITTDRVGGINKSYKDVLCLRSIGIQSVAESAESILLSPTNYWFMKTKFDYLFSCLDYDRTGMIMSSKLRKVYRIDPIMFTNGLYGSKNYGSKDASAFVRANGIDALRNIVGEYFKKHYFDFREDDKYTYNALKNIK